ncbi:putative VPS9 domain protein [Taphrina deformans PYCC 5710]|uniref:VPS9 domain protein n=1 Tax=Taphrina deformans (strain PYCC 5710 / ATCC 11124 / CBS 356.35 / IMI 108563 / JCM 9778 / NBRC 8474) TaxID=1097556 RepID=R4XHI2_TAPDE|nr:putative VPS9 domain protein [Taphrina deformans PYCC 5710]|eukprot:CCG82877.1 putative VPS9 domain protein [Taphrina deformans PYCC 5710]
MFQDFYSGMEELVHDLLPDDSTIDAGEMFSNEEIAEQKVRRLQADTKRQEWREDIEQLVCTEMYEKIFELKTSTDELRDEALMSKIIAMNLIGVSLEQLGVGLSDSEWQDMQPTITLIGEELQSLNNAISPKAKIDILVACHKQIVAEVQHTKITDDSVDLVESTRDETIMPAADKPKVMHAKERKHLGADAILPILIFSIIKSNPAKLVSHFQYVQRFRTSGMLIGEAAYCLTNLEAAIGFLEGFDDGGANDLDPLRNHISHLPLKTSNSTTSLSSSIRAGERARALSSAAQEVYDFADERMKMLGSQFGSQLGALVGRVSQPQDLDDVRSLMGLPPKSEPLVEDSFLSASTPTQKSSTGSASSSLRKDLRTTQSPQKGTTTVPAANVRPGSSFGRLSGLGMIKNISNSFSATRSVDSTPKPGTREMQSMEDKNVPVLQNRERSNSDAANTLQMPTTTRLMPDRFLQMSADDLTIRDVRELLENYKQLLQHTI